MKDDVLHKWFGLKNADQWGKIFSIFSEKTEGRRCDGQNHHVFVATTVLVLILGVGICHRIRHRSNNGGAASRNVNPAKISNFRRVAAASLIGSTRSEPQSKSANLTSRIWQPDRLDYPFLTNLTQPIFDSRSKYSEVYSFTSFSIIQKEYFVWSQNILFRWRNIPIFAIASTPSA